MPDDLKNKVASGLVWRGFERIGTLGVQFVISIILARLLLPKDFGTIAMITVFIGLASTFAESGFGTALIQKKKLNPDDYYSVFYFNIAFAVLLYFILFMAAPWIAVFYREPLLVNILRVLALTLIVEAFGKIQSTVLARDMLFKFSFKVNLAASLASGVIGISMAYAGFGLWSLVGATIGSSVIATILRWLVVGWRPRWRFSFKSIRSLFKYSSRILGSGLLDTIFNNIYTLIIGRLFNPTAVGHYNRGQSLPSLLVTSINGTIASIMFPAFAACQDDRARVKRIMRLMLTTTTFLVFPTLFGLAAVADPLVRLLLTEKWLPCVPYVQVSCITFAFWPVHVANIQVIKALGRSDIFLNLEIFKRVIIVAAILVTAPLGIMAMVIGQAVTSVICVVVNAWPNRKLVHYTPGEQIADIALPLVAALLMAVSVYCVGLFIANLVLRLAIQIFLGGVLYLALCRIFGIDSYQFLLQNIKSWLLPRLNDKLSRLWQTL